MGQEAVRNLGHVGLSSQGQGHCRGHQEAQHPKHVLGAVQGQVLQQWQGDREDQGSSSNLPLQWASGQALSSNSRSRRGPLCLKGCHRCVKMQKGHMGVGRRQAGQGHCM